MMIPPEATGANDRPDVSVLIPVLNEERFIRDVAAAMLAQEYDGELEFLFLDGGSTDGTEELLEEIARRDPRVQVVHNPRRRQAPALNLGLSRARGEFIARMDAHTFYPSNYVSTAVARFRQGGVECVAGPQLAVGVDPESERIATALRSPLGVGGATFRRVPDREIETDSAFTGVWRRKTLLELGGWDEAWLVNEDGELAARIRERGGRIVCIPEMAADCVTRSGLRALARQYWIYGNDRAKTASRHELGMRGSHFGPPGLVLAVAAAMGRGRIARLARTGVLGYLVAVLVESARRSDGFSPAETARLAAVFITMHAAWGAGFLAGSARFGPPTAGIKGLLRAQARAR